MTNLAYKQNYDVTERSSNLSYVDFAAHAASRSEQQRKKALCLQHRYGAILLLACIACILVGFVSYATDLTAVLVFVPLGIYLLLTKKVILYRPNLSR